MNPSRFKTHLVLILLLGLGVPALGSAVMFLGFAEWRWAHHPFHSVLEGLGACIALALAGLFLTFRRDHEGYPHQYWMACALTGMGLLDAFHAAVEPGETFVWLHSTATLVGGLLFALVWIPDHISRSQETKKWPTLIAIGAVGLGLFSILYPTFQPAMVIEGAFTPLARALNIMGGFFFFVAALRFIVLYRTSHQWDDWLFAIHCTLFGAAGILFELSELWDPAWWWWHGLRLAAYGVALSYMVLTYNQSIKERQKEQRAIRQLYNITSSSSLTSEAKMQGILEMGCQVFHLPIGILGKVENEQYEVVAVTSPGQSIAKGTMAPLGHTYCRNTLETDGPIGIEHAGESEWRTHPAYGESKLEAYLGTPVHVGTTVYGTLNFSSKDPRQRTFTDIDKDVLQLMAQWVGSELKRQQTEEARYQAEDELQTTQQQLLDQQRQETVRVESELQKTREALVRQARLAALGQLSASIGHELRNPLGVIRNALYLIKKRFPMEDQKGQEYLGIIEEEVQSSNRIIGDLLEMARGKDPIKKEFDLAELARNVTAQIAPDNDLGCDYFFESEPFMIWADSMQIQQVFHNLTLNAVQAMEGESHISITATHQPTEEVITVHDDGPGIPPEIRSQLFEPLVMTKTRGTGLGLTIYRQILERHGGSIELADEPSPGTTFAIRLPRKEGSLVARDSSLVRNDASRTMNNG